jgi:hypothetical protein
VNTRNSRTPSEYIGYGLYLYFSGLSLREVSEIDYHLALLNETMFFLGKNGTDGFRNIILVCNLLNTSTKIALLIQIK